MDLPEDEVKTMPCTWRVEEADEARYNFSDQKGVWQPKPEDILSVFEQLAKGGALPLKWTCPGRRAPESDTPNEKETEMETEMAEDQSKEDYNNPEPSAFDFDDSLPDTNTKVTPWRAHAGMARTPKTEKRVARMDNIMDSLRKQQIQRAAEREARKSKSGTPSRVQQGRGRLIKFGSPLSKKTSPTPPISSLFSASPPSDSVDPERGTVNVSSSSVTVASSSTMIQSNMNNASLNVSASALASSPLRAQGQDFKSAEENTLDGQQQSFREKDSKHEESVEATSASLNMSSSSSSSHPTIVMSSSDAQKQHAAAVIVPPGLSYQNSEQKSETSAGQVTLGESVSPISSDVDVKTSSSLVSKVTSTSLSSSTSVTQKTSSANSNGSLPKASSSSHANTLLGVTKPEENLTKSSSAVLSATGTTAASVNESHEQFTASSSTEAMIKMERVKSSESISFPLTANPSLASSMPEPSLQEETG